MPPILAAIRKFDQELTERFRDKLVVNHRLDRTLVSFQANKHRNGYRWFKYKEGFSASLIQYLLDAMAMDSGLLLDPFAGSGAALFAASARGMDAVGIELLPVGCEIIRARTIALMGDAPVLAEAIRRWARSKPWSQPTHGMATFSHLRITAGAFPPETETALGKYLASCQQVPDESIRTLLRFAAMCILEEISYTRKDGQYLRWDYRSGRRQGAKIFDKGDIVSLDQAIERKLAQICNDLLPAQTGLFSKAKQGGTVKILAGSCLDCLPAMDSGTVDCLLTSPPYCNRYDYTRTYALELAFLGTNEDQLKELRQAMISCTVENRTKQCLDQQFGTSTMERARRILGGQKLFNQIVEYLEAQKQAGLLNNNGVPRMVRNYFWEMTLVIAECARILKPHAPLIMVNDNVRYQGASIPVDLILSDIASEFGFQIEKIWVLPIGKGNSSQQMGRHGRDELRKCIYLWRAPKGK